MDAGTTYHFASCYFYSLFVMIDGKVVHSQDGIDWDNYNMFSSFTPTKTGWHSVKIGTSSNGNGGGACHDPSNNRGALSAFYPLSIGLAWNTNGVTTVTSDNVGQWKKLLDAGDRHLFRARGKQGECAFLDQTPRWTKTSLTVPVRIDSLVPGMALTVYATRRENAWYFEDRWEKSATVASVPSGASVQSVTFSGIDTSCDWYVSARLSDGAKFDQWTDPVKWTPAFGSYEKPTFSVEKADGVAPMAFGGPAAAPTVTITINNASDDAVYAVYASATLGGAYTRVSAKQTRAGALLSFEIDATAATRFFQIKAADSESALP